MDPERVTDKKGDLAMAEQTKIIDLNLLVDEEIAELFTRAANKNGYTAKEVLLGFMKDYAVSGGHPEQVANGRPWSRKD